MSFPRHSGQIPVYYNHKPSGGRSNWSGDYIDRSAKPLFPFGYGLSYTTFDFKNIRIDSPQVRVNEIVNISVDAINTEKLSGDEVVQLYVEAISFKEKKPGVTRPLKELKGFKRINLEPGEKKTVTFHLDTRTLAHHDLDMRFAVDPGKVMFYIENSSKDDRAFNIFEIIGEKTEIKNDKVFFNDVSLE
jgi:beta-glucosidase